MEREKSEQEVSRDVDDREKERERETPCGRKHSHRTPRHTQVPTLLQKYKGKEEQLLAAMVKKYGPEPEPEDDAADAAATDEEDDEHPRVAPGKNADGADDDEELAQPAPEEPFARGVRCFFFDAARRWRALEISRRRRGDTPSTRLVTRGAAMA